ncbi:MAG: ankyrin repeat domain-containing protein, partial [Acidobacteria bacterium]|nr:ankyrin repeat domain-containing protein [Acidobacteriota bacterium]
WGGCGWCPYFSGSSFPPEPFIPPLLALATAIISFIAFRMSLKSSIEHAVLYLSARKARGEAVDELSNRPFTEINPTVHWVRGRIYATAAFLIMLIAGSQYFKFESMPFLMERGAVNTVKALNASGVPVPYWSGNSRLNALWVTSYPPMVRYFNEKGAGINDSVILPPLFGSVVTTPLMSAIMSQTGESVRLLIRRGADLHAQDSKGRTPLMVAAIYNPRAIEQLITAGADVNQPTKQGTALQVAARYQWLYMRRGREIRKVDNAVRILLENGANPDVRDSEGRTPLMLSSLEKRIDPATVETAEALLTAGGDINARDNKGRTPLMYAVKYKRNDLIRFLMRKGADVKATDNYGMSAQKIAEQAGNNDIVRMLQQTDIELGFTLIPGVGTRGFINVVEGVGGAGEKPGKKPGRLGRAKKEE